MTIIGAEQLDELFAGVVGDLKMVFNSRGAVVFSSKRQHRDVGGDGIRYEDDYKGSALAAMVRRDAIEIRFHRDFSDAAVAGIVERLLGVPSFSRLSSARVTYQGRTLRIGRKDAPG